MHLKLFKFLQKIKVQFLFFRFHHFAGFQVERQAERGPLPDRDCSLQEPQVHQDPSSPAPSPAQETVERRDRRHRDSIRSSQVADSRLLSLPALVLPSPRSLHSHPGLKSSLARKKVCKVNLE